MIKSQNVKQQRDEGDRLIQMRSGNIQEAASKTAVKGGKVACHPGRANSLWK